MSEAQGVSVREALLQRLRFERSMGMDVLPRVPLARKDDLSPEAAPLPAVPPPTSATARLPQPTTPPDAAHQTELFPIEGEVAGLSASSRAERFEALRRRAPQRTT